MNCVEEMLDRASFSSTYPNGIFEIAELTQVKPGTTQCLDAQKLMKSAQDRLK